MKTINAKPKHRACHHPLRVEIFARLDVGLPGQHVLHGCNDQVSADQKLLGLAKALGWIAAGVENHQTAIVGDELECLLGFTFGWLMQLGEEMPFDKIHAERVRQEKLFRTGKITLNVASPTPDVKRKLRVLVEEVGEVAQAIDQLELAENSPRGRMQYWRFHLCEELIQVAAVTVAWMESLQTATESQTGNRKS